MIEVDKLCKNYGDLEALKAVSFSAESGRIIGVLGLNAAGKSTLLRVLAGELTPTSGSVSMNGIALTERSRAYRARIGYLPEGAPLYPDMTVRRFLQFAGKLRGMRDKAKLTARIDEVATLTNIRAELPRVIGELSMGFRKRVGIAQAILADPDVVILDEPVSSLDPAEIVGMRSLVRSLGGKHTVFVSSHILHEIQETCDEVLMLRKGALVDLQESAMIGVARDASESHRFLLEVSGERSAIEAVVGDAAEIESFDHVGDAGVFKVAVRMDDDRREELVNALVAGGVGVRELSRRASDLEELFLSQIQEAVG